MVNEAFSQITGYTLKELSTTEQWRQKTKGIKKNMDVLEIDKFFEDNIRVNMGEVTITTKNNQKLVWIVSLAPLGNVYNGKRVMIYSAMDITQMHENEELMLAQSRQAAMGDMIGMIAHQWRQPLSIIAMVANNLKASLELEEEISSSEIDKLTGILTEQTQYLSHTIDDFRTFFKPEKQKEKIILCKIYEKLGNMIETLLENNKINLHFVNECEVVLYTYPNELIQVMINLINNAKDAIIERDVQDGKIEITTTFTVDLLSIVVSDNAGGIDESIIDKLGEPYVTTKSANGTGLGIYMSLIILQKHFEGHLTWKNCNRGSCFTIELPLKNLEEEA
jgi:two-component system CheB/CheR fusion protein